MQALLACSQGRFQISTSFDNVKVDQVKRRFVAVKETDVSLFDAYKNHKKGKIYINYESSDTIAAIAQVEDAPMMRGNKALHFKINSPNVAKEGKKTKSRIQIDIVKKPGLKSFVSEVSVFLPHSMNELNNYPYPITWLTLQEYWNAPPNNKGATFRISLGLWKSKTGKLHFGFKAQDYIDGKYIDVEKGDDERLEVPLGRWFRLRTELIEGGQDTGFMKVAMVNGKKEHILYKRKMRTMATVFCEKKYSPQGFTLIQPIKLYTSARLTEYMKERRCAIDAYFTDWKLDAVPYPHQ
jgi:hypothetical protein